MQSNGGTRQTRCMGTDEETTERRYRAGGDPSRRAPLAIYRLTSA